MPGRALSTAVALGMIALLLAAGSPVAASPPDRDVLFDRPLHGEAAVSAVRGEPAVLGSRNRTTAHRVVKLLDEDPAVQLDRTGQLLVADTDLPPRPGKPGRGGTATDTAPYSLEQTFRLHSRPGAQRTIVLDFDGHTVVGTAWNSSFGLSAAPQPAFDLDGSSASWSQAEHDIVQSVHRRVAEDFAPFDVDVTTEEPAPGVLERSNAEDGTFGTRILITPGAEAHAALCAGRCGGIAYVGVFDRVGDNTAYQPGWVFSNALWGHAKYLAEAASHEAGHNLGLWHHGTTDGLTYYDGHDNWAPIMGVGYYRPLVQWSSGEYARADNPGQDDVAVMRAYGLPLRPDDHSSEVQLPEVVHKEVAVHGTVDSRADVDVFVLKSKCSGLRTVRVILPVGSPNLDARLRVRGPAGQVVAEDDPVSGTASFDEATGLSASFTSVDDRSRFTVEVDGVGATSAYSDYGSLGAYRLDVGPCRKR